MTDVHDKMTRSYNMSQIKAKNTKPELMVRRFLQFGNVNKNPQRLKNNFRPTGKDVILQLEK